MINGYLSQQPIEFKVPLTSLDANKCVATLIDLKFGMFNFLKVFFLEMKLRLLEESPLAYQTIHSNLFGDALLMVNFLSKVHIVAKRYLGSC